MQKEVQLESSKTSNDGPFVVPEGQGLSKEYSPQGNPSQLYDNSSGFWKLREITPPSYDDVEGGFVVASEEERGKLSFASPFKMNVASFIWHGRNTAVQENKLLMKDSSDPNIDRFFYEPILYQQSTCHSPLKYYVYTGDFYGVPVGCFILFNDLQARLAGNSMITNYERDYDQCLEGNFNHFPVWDKFGKRITDGEKFINFFGSIYSLEKTYLDAQKTFQLNLVKVFRKFCNIALATSIEPTSWSVLARAWDAPSVQALDATIYVRDAYCKKAMDDALEEIYKDPLFKFQPQCIVEVTTFDQELSEKAFSVHPASLYAFSLPSKECLLLKEAVKARKPPLTESFLFPGPEVDLKTFDDTIGTKLLGPEVSDSNFNMNTIAAAANMPRCKSQLQVMNNISASEIATALEWKHPDKPRHMAEWLHRSAYSFGGLQFGKPNSSQTPENLVFGTVEANTMMIRYEEHLKRAARSGIVPGGVNIKTTLEGVSTTHEKQRPWLAKKLDYHATYTPTGANTHVVDKKFDLFSTRLPTRFELRLDELFDKHYFKIIKTKLPCLVKKIADSDDSKDEIPTKKLHF